MSPEPKEDEALAGLLAECDTSTVEAACSAFNVWIGVEKGPR